MLLSLLWCHLLSLTQSLIQESLCAAFSDFLRSTVSRRSSSSGMSYKVALGGVEGNFDHVSCQLGPGIGITFPLSTGEPAGDVLEEWEPVL